MAQLIHCHSLDGFTLLAPAHPGSPGKRAAKHASSSAVANNIVQKNIIINYLFMMIFLEQLSNPRPVFQSQDW